MKKVVVEAGPVLVEFKMYIFIFVLKLLEFFFYQWIASGYPNIVDRIMEQVEEICG